MSFGLPERNGINAAFLTDGHRRRHDLGDHNPLHEEVMRAVMGADVMMGHDPDCMRWIRKFRADPPVGADGEPGRGRREGGRGRKVGRTRMMEQDALVVFTPSGRRGRFPGRHAGAAGRRSWAWTSTRSAAGAASAAAARWWSAKASSPSMACVSQADHPDPVRRGRAGLLRDPDDGAGPPPGLLGAAAGRRGDRRALGSQVHRQVVRKAAEAHDIELDPVIRLHFVEVQQPDMHDPPATCAGWRTRWNSSGA